MDTRRPPLTADEARGLIAEMQAETPRGAAIAVLKLALGRHGNLSPEAAELYRAELERLDAAK